MSDVFERATKVEDEDGDGMELAFIVGPIGKIHDSARGIGIRMLGRSTARMIVTTGCHMDEEENSGEIRHYHVNVTKDDVLRMAKDLLMVARRMEE